MPIRPENKNRYPKNWNETRERILKRANNRCEWCGVRNHAFGFRDSDGVFHEFYGDGLVYPDEVDKSIKIVLTVAHLDHTPDNCSDSNLKALCQRCHNRYDATMRASGRRKRQAREVGQFDLIELD